MSRTNEKSKGGRPPTAKLKARDLPPELEWKKTSRWNRAHWEIIRAVLQALSRSTEPTPYSRMLYICRTTYNQLPKIFAEMRELQLIQVVKEKAQINGTRKSIAITEKGKRVLHLLDQQAELIPNAPWLIENTE